MRATHLQAEERYTTIRQAALSTTLSLLPPSPGLDLRLFSASALSRAKEWDEGGNRIVDWDWFSGYSAFRFRYPKRFELAIWQGDKLIGMSLGRPTYAGSGMRLDFLEANPEPDRIRVFPITFAALVIYAKALGANEIRVMQPINEAVKAYYERFGFKYITKGDYLFIRMEAVRL
jgi:hypothetical protein